MSNNDNLEWDAQIRRYTTVSTESGVCVPHVRNFVSPKHLQGGQLATIGNNTIKYQDSCRLTNYVIQQTVFTNCNLDLIRMHGVAVRNCVFENCTLRSWKLFSSDIEKCRFVNCDIDLSMNGNNSIDVPTKHHVQKSVFDNCRLSGSVANMCFDACEWHGGSIIKFEFASCTLIECLFESMLLEVEIGKRLRSDSEAMVKNCSFYGSVFRSVFFRWATCVEVVWPQNNNHIAIKSDYPNLLGLLISELDKKPGVMAKAISARFKKTLEWTSVLQPSGVISLLDIREAHGNDGERLVRDVLEHLLQNKIN